MNKTTSSKTSIKDLNAEYARLFEAYGFTKAAKRLRESAMVLLKVLLSQMLSN